MGWSNDLFIVTIWKLNDWGVLLAFTDFKTHPKHPSYACFKICIQWLQPPSCFLFKEQTFTWAVNRHQMLNFIRSKVCTLMFWHDIDIIIMKYWLVSQDICWITSTLQEEKFAVPPFNLSDDVVSNFKNKITLQYIKC